MPSRAELRAGAEWALRAGALAALGVVLWRWTCPAPPAAPADPEVVGAAALGGALARWTASPAPAAHAALGAVPEAERRDWLRALAGAGMRVGWSAPTGGDVAAAAWPIADPAGGVLVDVASRGAV